MKKYILLSKNHLTKEIYDEFLLNRNNEEWVLITDKKQFTKENIKSINPTKIFIPHWSHIIPTDITDAYECIVFHLTDLPYGRGGSPLQNLIVRGHKTTKITAIQIDGGIDTGDIYLKEDLTLEGTAQQIFERSNPLIKQMIEQIIDDDISPYPQEGDAVVFRRRKPTQSDISALHTPSQVYDYIRMLDAPGYPPAYLLTSWIKFSLTEAIRNEDGTVEATVTIAPRQDKTDKEILDTIEGIREENNKNWVDLLRLAMEMDAPRMRKYIESSLTK
jgi:methionyl-tRNA formyltransferase